MWGGLKGRKVTFSFRRRKKERTKDEEMHKIREKKVGDTISHSSLVYKRSFNDGGCLGWCVCVFRIVFWGFFVLVLLVEEEVVVGNAAFDRPFEFN